LALQGAFLLIPEPVEDLRGFFARNFCADQLANAGLVTHYPEWSISFNSRRGTMRGLHWQAAPNTETKLVHCTRGAVFDVIVDMRVGSKTYGKWQDISLNSENRHMLYIPAGCAHGFQTLEDQSELHYYISKTYRPDGACGVRWNDPDLSIVWPAADQRIISKRDAMLPLLSEIEKNR